MRKSRKERENELFRQHLDAIRQQAAEFSEKLDRYAATTGRGNELQALMFEVFGDLPLSKGPDAVMAAARAGFARINNFMKGH